MRKETDFIEVKELREKTIDRIDVLDKVGTLLLLPNTEYATTEMVAEFYNESVETIRQVVVRHNKEIVSDGYKTLTGNELSDIKSLCQIKSRARSLAIFPKRAILRIGMLLRDSNVAIELRTKLLDIIQKAEAGNGNAYVETIQDNNEELMLQMNIGRAYASGDINALLKATAELNAYNKKKTEYYDNVLNSDKLITVTDIAKDLGMSARKLNAILNEEKIQFKQGGNWKLYSKYENRVPDYCDYHITEFGQTLKWTERGREWIISLVDKHNKAS